MYRIYATYNDNSKAFEISTNDIALAFEMTMEYRRFPRVSLINMSNCEVYVRIENGKIVHNVFSVGE